MDSPLFLTILVLLLCSSSSANLVDHQTFFPGSLPSKPSLVLDADDTTWSISSSEVADEFATEESGAFRLVHIDAFSHETSPQSLFLSRLSRDASRVEHLTRTKSATSTSTTTTTTASSSTGGFRSAVTSGLAVGSGEYFTRLGTGTPVKSYYFVIDTGSDIIWLQCLPCTKCYKQSDPIFMPSRSSTFSYIPCNSSRCSLLDGPPTCGKANRCQYAVSYGDRSMTTGDFVVESLYFGRWKVNNIALGCGHQNTGLFVGAAGLLGLGRGPLALPAQTGRSVRKIFSYCLADRNSATTGGKSSIIFGAPEASPPSTVFVSLLKNPQLQTFYYLGLTGLRVGGSIVRGLDPSMLAVNAGGNGGVIIDSGTSVTRLTSNAYIPFRNAFRKGMKRMNVSYITSFLIFDTCYYFNGKGEVKVPTVDLVFGDVRVALPATNYIIPVSNDGKYCFAFAATDSGMSIIGNIQQQGFRITYDLEKSQVGFTAKACG